MILSRGNARVRLQQGAQPGAGTPGEVASIPLRICMLVYHYWPGPEGGTERQCRKLAAALTRRGVACTVLTTRAYRGVPWREQDGAVRIVRLPTWDAFRRNPVAAPGSGAAPATPRQRPLLPPHGRAAALAGWAVGWLNSLLFQLLATVWLTRHARKFDILNVHTSEWIAGLAGWVGRHERLPVLCKVATLPAFPALARDVPFRGLWDRQRRRVDFVALNEAMADDLRAGGVADGRIRVIPNSVELPEIRERREEPGLVLYVGNLSQHAWKAFDVLFDTWSLVSRAMPSARLVVLGGGDPSIWEQRLTKEGSRDSVSFEGFVRDVNHYYRRGALLVLPSRQEGMSNALLEAQSWGLPAVVSDIAGNRAVVADGETGLVVPVDDTAAFADGILKLLRDADLRHAQGAAARRRVERVFALDTVADQTLATCEALVRAGRGEQVTPCRERC